MADEQSVRDYVGLREPEALQLAIVRCDSIRITWKDGNYRIVTRDLHRDRVNIEIEDNRVTNSYLG